VIPRAIVAAAVLIGTVAAAPPPGASSCSGCHSATAPPAVLKGRDPADMIAALEAYRADARPATVMNRIAKGFSHDETAAIAIWLAAQK
jgi:sulfide dehydrogenase cytochrome subunit